MSSYRVPIDEAIPDISFPPSSPTPFIYTSSDASTHMNGSGAEEYIV